MLQLVASRDKPDFTDFYQEHYQKAVQYIYKKIGNLQDAQDLAGEVFLYCYSHYAEYDPEKSAPTTWLYLVINSRIKNHYRDARNFVDLDSLSGVLADERNDMDDAVYLEQMKKMLERAIAQLPQRQQKIVTMRYFEDRSSSEIADALGLTPGNVRVLLSRALDYLEKYCYE